MSKNNGNEVVPCYVHRNFICNIHWLPCLNLNVYIYYNLIVLNLGAIFLIGSQQKYLQRDAYINEISSKSIMKCKNEC